MPEPVKNSNNRLQIFDCGLAGYTELLKLQYRLRELIKEKKEPNTVLIAEHYPVITFGAREKLNRLVVKKSELARRGVHLVTTRRGGGATAHNPGQLVVYPILKLDDFHLGISEYVRKLEAIGAGLLEKLGLECSAKPGYPGLWVGKKKIASIGVRVSRGVSFHGMAINICNDLSIFDLIEPCGLRGIQIISAQKKHAHLPAMPQVKHLLRQVFIRHLEAPFAEFRKFPKKFRDRFTGDSM